MVIKNIFMELRARLRSCNVFITTTVDFKKKCNLKISIQASCIVLNYYPNEADDRYAKDKRSSLLSIESLFNCYSDDDSEVTEVIPVEEFCRIIPNSMSGLKIENSSISFRILTEPKDGGNFYKELLAPNSSSNNACSANNSKIEIVVGEKFKIVCANCMNVLSDNVIQFDRILELPTENLDMTEWFCHNHGESSQDHTTLTVKSNKFDLLFRLCFFVVSYSMLSDKTNKFNAKREIYHCNRCLAWIGLKSKDTLKLFNSTIKVSRDGIESAVLKHKGSMISDDVSLNDFIYTIECITKEFNLGFQYAIMCKIVLECSISADNKQFLLIWVMDKELQVLKNCDEFMATECEDKIQLVSSVLSKVLFKVEGLNEEVEMWMTDPSVVITEISKSMFYNGVEHLRNMSMKVPESFRTTNGYTVSYLKV